MLKELFQRFLQKGNLVLFILIIFGSLAWSLTMVKSGTIGDGTYFWGPNGHDGIWHIALSESLVRNIDSKVGGWTMPVFSGAALQNYHIGYDLLLAIINKLTNIPISLLYFQIMPPVLSVLIGVLTFKFVLLWKGSSKSALWSVFFVYFGGSFGWLLGKGESAFWATQAISTLVNPPFAFSLVMILSGLISLLYYKKTSKLGYIILSILSFGLLVGFKAYAGVLILGGLLVASVYQVKVEKKFWLLKIFLGSLLVSMVLLVSSKVSSFPFVWKPFWFLETMMGFSDRVGWGRFSEAMVNYKASGNLIKGVPAYLFAILVFWYGNMGTRLISELSIFSSFKNKKIDSLMVLVYSVVLAGGIIPIFFLQVGTAWNTIQFFYYSLFFSGILAGIAIGNIKKLNWIVYTSIILLTIPTTIITLKDVYIPGRAPAKISEGEATALKFLSEQPDGIILTYPFDKAKADEAVKNPPRPLYLYESTAYVSAYSRKDVFLEDEVNLDITGYDWKGRRVLVEDWYGQDDPAIARELLTKEGIAYIYLVNGQMLGMSSDKLGLTEIYKNSEATIYKVE